MQRSDRRSLRFLSNAYEYNEVNVYDTDVDFFIDSLAVSKSILLEP